MEILVNKQQFYLSENCLSLRSNKSVDFLPHKVFREEEEEDSELVNMNINHFYVCAAENSQGTFKGHQKLDV